MIAWAIQEKGALKKKSIRVRKELELIRRTCYSILRVNTAPEHGDKTPKLCT